MHTLFNYVHNMQIMFVMTFAHLASFIYRAVSFASSQVGRLVKARAETLMGKSNFHVQHTGGVALMS